MSKHRIPRKKIAMQFKEGYGILTLAARYKDYFPGMGWAAREAAIIDIIRQYMQRQDK